MIKNMKTITAYGNVDWFESAEQPNSFEELPACFQEAFELWTQDPAANVETVINLLQPYLQANFIPENVCGADAIIGDGSGDFLEIPAFQIKLVGVDFDTNPLPLVKAEALFEVPVTEEFDSVSNFEEWQSENDYFHSAVIFGWSIPDCELDLTAGNHQGTECILPYTK
jgi:hypothetical protein